MQVERKLKRKETWPRRRLKKTRKVIREMWALPFIYIYIYYTTTISVLLLEKPTDLGFLACPLLNCHVFFFNYYYIVFLFRVLKSWFLSPIIHDYYDSSNSDFHSLSDVTLHYFFLCSESGYQSIKEIKDLTFFLFFVFSGLSKN